MELFQQLKFNICVCVRQAGQNTMKYLAISQHSASSCVGQHSCQLQVNLSSQLQLSSVLADPAGPGLVSVQPGMCRSRSQLRLTPHLSSSVHSKTNNLLKNGHFF